VDDGVGSFDRVDLGAVESSALIISSPFELQPVLLEKFFELALVFARLRRSFAFQ
jgi:hypothetical protein